MNERQETVSEEASQRPGTEAYARKWHKSDTTWMLSMFGTAIGAGVLFLPIDAGSVGVIGLLFIAVLAYPTTVLAHRALKRFVLSARHPGDDITDVVEQHWGFGWGLAFTVVYFLSIFPTMLVYAISIVNTTQSFIVNQMHLASPPRWLLSLVLIALLMGVVALGTKVITKVMSILVYPFVIVLVLFSLYLIPHWNGAILTSVPRTASGGLDVPSLLLGLWLLIPTMIFAFNHSSVVSSFTVDERERYGDEFVEEKTSRIMRYAELMMVLVVLFFVFSCALSLSPAEFAQAKAQNVSVLTMVANKFSNPIISDVAPFISFVAVAKAFFGHYMGTSEAMSGFIRKVSIKRGKVASGRMLKIGVWAIIFVCAWVAAWANLSVMKMIETMIGPIIAFVLFLMPMIAVRTVPSLKKYSGKVSNVLLVVFGLVAVSAIFYNIVMLFQ